MPSKEDMIEVVNHSTKLIRILYERKFDGDPNDDDVFQMYADEQEAFRILDYVISRCGYGPQELDWLRETVAKYEVI